MIAKRAWRHRFYVRTTRVYNVWFQLFSFLLPQKREDVNDEQMETLLDELNRYSTQAQTY